MARRSQHNSKRNNTKRNNTKRNIAKRKSSKHSQLYNFLEKFWYIFIILLTTTIYFQTATFDIVECDDHEIINRDFERIDDIGQWYNEFSKSYMYNSYYRPIVNISFMLNAQMSGKSPISYHITNIIIHAVVACLIYILMLNLGYRKNIALIAASIYAVHPIFVNAVAWIVGRNDLIFSLFILSSFIFLIKYQNVKKIYFFGAHTLFFLIAIFSKETAIVSPILFASYLVLLKRIKIIEKQNLLYIISWIGVITFWYLIRINADLGEAVYKTGVDVFIFNLSMLPEFIAKFFIPVQLSVLPTYSIFNTVIGIIIMLLISYIIYKNKSVLRKNYLIFGLVWFAVIIIPGMFITLQNSHIWNEYLECRAYLAMLGLIIVSIELLPKRLMDNKSSSLTYYSLIIIIILSIMNILESNHYKNPQSFYESAIEDDSGRASFHFILGQIYHNKLFAKSKDIKYIEMAEDEMAEAIRLRPNHALYYQSLGSVYANNSKFGLAIKNLKKAIELDSNVSKSYNHLGLSYYLQKKYTDAAAIWRKGLEKWHAHKEMLQNITDVYLRLRIIDSALFFTKRALSLDTSSYNIYSFCYLYNKWGGKFLQKGDYEEGTLLLENAIIIDPKSFAAYENLMNYYLTVEQRYDIAATYAKKLIQLGKTISPEKLQAMNQYLK